MSKSKSDDLNNGPEEDGRVLYQRTKSPQHELLSHANWIPQITVIKEDNGVLRLHEDELAIGSSIQPANRNTYGTVGPFVMIKETQDLCFLTVRNIFGPYQRPETFKGTAVFLSGNGNTVHKRQCGETLVDEISEDMDVVLVKVTEECKPQKTKFIDVEKRKMKSLGFQANYFSLYGNTNSVMDARDLTSKYIDDNYRLMKVGSGTGLSQGTFQYTNGVVKTDSFFMKRESESPDGTVTEFIRYKNQLLVHPVGNNEFANAKDVGAAVYLIDKSNLFHCIGIVLYVKDDSVLVTPIQEILHCLGNNIGKTLELVTFDSPLQQMDNELFNQKEKEIFDRALRMGSEKDKHMRINIIGFYAQGKTSLTKRLLQEPLQYVESTDGIDVHIRKCKIRGSEWKRYDPDNQLQDFSRRLVSVSKDLKDENASSCDEKLDLTTPLHSDQSTFQNILEENSISLKIDDSKHSGSGAEKIYATYDNSNPTSTSTRIPAKSKAFLKNFIEELYIYKSSIKDELTATIWDFGGQYIYYTTHQIFHSRDAIYLLVFNLNKGLDNIIEDYDFPGRQEKMKNSLMFWVNSINAYVGTDDSTMPIVILVGTHKDSFKGSLEAKFNAVKDLFAGTAVRNHIVEPTFAIENFNMADTVIEDLRQTIYDIGIKRAEAKNIPASWLHLEVCLLDVKQKHIVSFKEVLDLSSKIDLPLENAEELKVFLKYHHDKGTIVYFDEEELDEYVVLHPQFLVDAFRCIITSKIMCDGSSILHPLWKRMTSMAILEKQLLDAVWGKNYEFAHFSEILLKFLKRHRILAEILEMEGNGPKISFRQTQNYIIPSFLKVDCSDQTTENFIDGKTWSSVILGLSLENNVIISTVYERVLAALLCNSSPIQFRDQNLVFQNMAYIKLNHRFAGRIQKVDNQGLELMVIKLYVSEENSNVVCDDFRRKVETVVRQEFRKLQNDSIHDPFNHYIKCNNIFHKGHGSKQSYKLDNIKNETSVSCPDNESHGIEVHLAVKEWFHKKINSIVEIGDTADRIVTDDELIKIAEEVGENWELLAISLGVSNVSIQKNKIERMNSGIATVIFYVLKEWKDHIANKALLSDLIDKMKNIQSLSVNWEKIKKAIFKRK